MPYPPEGYNICPCCGTEFENDDVEFTYQELRDNWINGGASWFYGNPPLNWNAWSQLAQVAYGVHTESVSVRNVNFGIIGLRQFQVA